MIKSTTLFLLITCMMLVFTFSVTGEYSSARGTDDRTHMGNTVQGTGIRAGVGADTTGTNRAYGTNDNGINNTGTRTDMNYRATAVTNNRYNWSWLGLLGLIGLAGLRNRGRERT